MQEFEERGLDPYTAVLGLLQGTNPVHSDSLDVSFMAHLEQHCGTNYVPSDDDRRHIQEFRAQVLSELSTIAAKMELHQGQLSNLQSRNTTIHKVLDPYLALVSPMRRIPAEILQEIFMHCLRSKDHPIMHTSEAPLLLGRVCSAWRTISLSTPSLWSSVHVVIPPPQGVRLTEFSPITDSPNVSARYGGLRTWFRRSGDCPLSVSLFAPDSFDFPKFTRAFVDLIISYQRRCKFPRVPPSLRGLSLNLDHAKVILAGLPWEQTLGAKAGAPGSQLLPEGPAPGPHSGAHRFGPIILLAHFAPLPKPSTLTGLRLRHKFSGPCHLPNHAIFRTVMESHCKPALPHGISCLRRVDVRLVWQAAFNVCEFEAAIQGSCGVQISIKAPPPPMNPGRTRGCGFPSYHASDSNFDMHFSEPTLTH
ncbi:hypothetical protein C8R43DRAFT_1201906 [Mycena crocata]|nr:hypothetical protein C8R43DRAFT_1201906 [Mycena crocata]